MITDAALQVAAKEASLALAETLVQGSKQQPPYSPSKSFTCGGPCCNNCMVQKHFTEQHRLPFPESHAAADVAGLCSDMAARRL